MNKSCKLKNKEIEKPNEQKTLVVCSLSHTHTYSQAHTYVEEEDVQLY
jgi:phosphopantetheinyl transferase (holo-ACP synthase)